MHNFLACDKYGFPLKTRANKNKQWTHYLALNILFLIFLYASGRTLSHIFKQPNTEFRLIKGVLHLWAFFLKTLCIFSKNKATSDKVSYGSGQKCSKELENYSFTSVETIVVKLQ